MSFLDSLKSGAVDALHTTANALHEQLATALSLAGHNVTPDTPTETLVSTAAAAGTATQAAAAGKPGTVAPNFADFALATFANSMNAALVLFAQAHLPSKFHAAAVTAGNAVETVLADGKVTPGEIAHAAVDVGAAVLSAASPFGAAVAAMAEPLAESVINSVTDGQKTAVQALGDVAAPVVAAVSNQVAGAAVTAVNTAISGVITNALDKLVPAPVIPPQL